MRNLLYGVLLAFALSCSTSLCAAEESRAISSFWTPRRK